ncbi:Phosphoglycerate mutase family protein [Euphorbia peplus]|nr:Phosphoglycerate mutase family protein [Euphorbia peplus]
MDSSSGDRYQNIVVMRHGDRIDNFDPLWASKADKPWDPPLVEEGKVRAFCTGRNLKSRLRFPIHRVFVSPFLRCVQTAAEVVSALCAVDDDDVSRMVSDSVAIDSSKIKVAIEYGLCEMMNTQAIRHDFAPKDGDFRFDIREVEALLPAGTVDHSVKPVCEELPEWEETVAETRSRYEYVFKALADKYPSENLLLVTHGEGVGVSISAFLKDTTVYEVDYCAYSELRRKVFQKDESSLTGDFEVLTTTSSTGIGFSSSLS